MFDLISAGAETLSRAKRMPTIPPPPMAIRMNKMNERTLSLLMRPEESDLGAPESSRHSRGQFGGGGDAVVDADAEQRLAQKM